MRFLRNTRLLLAAFAFLSAPPAFASEEMVWRWFQECHHPSDMVVEVRLDGRRLYRSAFPACRVNRSDLSKQDGRVLKFSFQAGRSIVWSGYRDDHETTQPREELEGNIWEAGGEASSLLLGVSFSTPDKIMMNTIHVADIAGRSQSEIASGLVVVTSPAKRSTPVPHD